MRGLTNGIEFLFKKNGVEYIKGAASLESDHTINAALLAGGERKIEATNIILATGSSGRMPCGSSRRQPRCGRAPRGQREGAHHRLDWRAEAV